MIDRREITRSETRRRRATARNAVADKTKAVAELQANALARAREVLADTTVIELLHRHGVHQIPRVLSPSAIHQIDARPDALDSPNVDCSLEFVVAWALLFPLFKEPDISSYLDTTWPGFILQMKDAFIAIVVEGPFPYAISGYRGRRHTAIYNPNRLGGATTGR